MTTMMQHRAFMSATLKEVDALIDAQVANGAPPALARTTRALMHAAMPELGQQLDEGLPLSAILAIFELSLAAIMASIADSSCSTFRVPVERDGKQFFRRTCHAANRIIRKRQASLVLQQFEHPAGHA